MARNNSIEKRTPDFKNILQKILAEDTSMDYKCLVCLEMLKNAHVTKCGHTFCYDCLEVCFNKNYKCPNCSTFISSLNDIFPNVMVNEQIRKNRQIAKIKQTIAFNSPLSVISDIEDFLTQSSNFETIELKEALTLLSEEKKSIETKNKLIHHLLLKHFLKELLVKKEQKLETINKDMEDLRKDIENVDEWLNNVKIGDDSGDKKIREIDDKTFEDLQSTIKNETEIENSTGDLELELIKGFNVPHFKGSNPETSTFTARKKRINLNIEALTDTYLSLRKQDENNKSNKPLENFNVVLDQAIKFSSARTLASTLVRAFNVITGIGFDKDGEYFAVSGIGNILQIYEFKSVINICDQPNFPNRDIRTNSKTTSLCWSNFTKTILASSSTIGEVEIWDVETRKKIKGLLEHENACTDVDFNKIYPNVTISSDSEGSVKLWDLNSARSIKTIKCETCVLSVKFDPYADNHLAFGGYDKKIHYYDIRNLKQPVSFCDAFDAPVVNIDFLSKYEIVSGSKTSQLKIWNVQTPNIVSSLKNSYFVSGLMGLATDGDYIVCGSETDALDLYHKNVEKKILRYDFPSITSPLFGAPESHCLTAACWKKYENVVVTANNYGILRVLQIV